ncbi:hypothetical protein KI387_015917 [Taxus chinensis]|uniref:Beta-glucosidase n=1 Tax=Taxus chinensis TaxID=29808 RepID=A0AA38GGN6_TAXCH|nr:hypothetical protein KI387_015917 [Taxus chinensis]
MNSRKGWRRYVMAVCMWIVMFRAAVDATVSHDELNRSSFPPGFIFGTASASYQYEGAANEGGRGPSIWDTFSHIPGNIIDGSNGDVAADEYHRYKEDVKLMKEMGMDAYRFSISWSRILPYIKPFVTLFHWDLPQALEDEYGGFLSQNIVKDFEDYSQVCFREFGDRVKHWITLNEPFAYVVFGVNKIGFLKPGRHFNPATEPYIIAHNLLLTHAAAVRLYRTNYQVAQKGSIGITLVSSWILPYSNTSSDRHAARRVIDFMFGWFMDPITKGKYPSTMRKLVGVRLPKFTDLQSDMVKGSFDFIGLNYYTSLYAFHVSVPPNSSNTNFPLDARANVTGIDEVNNDTLPLKEALNDTWRIDYHSKHLSSLHHAIRHVI